VTVHLCRVVFFGTFYYTRRGIPRCEFPILMNESRCAHDWFEDSAPKTERRPSVVWVLSRVFKQAHLIHVARKLIREGQFFLVKTYSPVSFLRHVLCSFFHSPSAPYLVGSNSFPNSSLAPSKCFCARLSPCSALFSFSRALVASAMDPIQYTHKTGDD
jgi:hypothetical protein